MRLLLDSCVWGVASRLLTDLGHDVEWTGDWERDPGDTEILAYANREDRILVTLDKDFGELVVVRGLPHPGIIRLVGFSAREQASTQRITLQLPDDRSALERSGDRRRYLRR